VRPVAGVVVCVLALFAFAEVGAGHTGLETLAVLFLAVRFATIAALKVMSFAAVFLLGVDVFVGPATTADLERVHSAIR